MVPGGFDHLCLRTAKKRVDGRFRADGGRQGRQALGPFLQALPGVGLQSGVAWLDRCGKAKVGQGLLVRAAHPGGLWQGRQSLQRGVHLLGAAFEQAAAAAREQRVATEEYG